MKWLIVPIVLAGIFFARSKLGDNTYDKIVGGFFLSAFAVVGLVLFYGWMMGR